MKKSLKREVRDILNILHSTNTILFKYPIGNRILIDKIKELERTNKIKFNNITSQWEKK